MGQSFILTYRRIWIVIVHICLWLGGYAASFGLRFDLEIPDKYNFKQLATWFLVLLFFRVILFYRMGGFQGLWRYTGANDAVTLFKGTAISSLLFALTVMLLGYREFPRSIFILEGMVSLSLVGGLRFGIRKINEVAKEIQSTSGVKTRILIVGAGNAGETLLRDLQKHLSFRYETIGFIDDDMNKLSLRIHGIPVLGGLTDIERVVRKMEIDEIIIAIPTATGEEMRRILDYCTPCGAQIRTIPGLDGLMDGRVSWSQVRDVHIDDLLGRAPVELETTSISEYIQDRTIMVTGAGGSIGGELCRQILRFHPRKLLLVERSENSLFEIHRELTNRFGYIDVIPCLADVTDRQRVKEIFATHHPLTVFHAAAHKHVPMVEWNPAEAIKNNVRGTRILAEEAIEASVERFVFISSDKAVRPTSVMGASKRLGEVLLQSFAKNTDTAFLTVRFGNVLGSAGSVIPIFKEQIKAGGPVTVTHPDMVRYFMTIPEACQLVMQAATMGDGGEIFILDMGEPMRVVDLAKDLIRLSGFEPDSDIAIVFTGVRPGEKLYEELSISGENITHTSHPKIFIGRHTIHAWRNFTTKLEALEKDASIGIERDVLIEKLIELVPEFTPESREERQPKPQTAAVISFPS